VLAAEFFSGDEVAGFPTPTGIQLGTRSKGQLRVL
jgi:hypothetical protein